MLLSHCVFLTVSFGCVAFFFLWLVLRVELEEPWRKSISGVADNSKALGKYVTLFPSNSQGARGSKLVNRGGKLKLPLKHYKDLEFDEFECLPFKFSGIELSNKKRFAKILIRNILRTFFYKLRNVSMESANSFPYFASCLSYTYCILAASSRGKNKRP